jgi:ornithine cyclodeaminase/alanine dehydrogenase-like protein (mu-crystallin family)
VTLLLRHDDVVDLLTLDEVIDAVRAGLAEQARGTVQLPPRITIDSGAGHGWLRLMPVIMDGAGFMGYKAMHSTPGVGVRYVVSLIDLHSGEVVALVDADWLTSRRTAAVATDLLASPRVRDMGLLGSSEQARALLSALSRVRAPSRVKVYSPNPAHREHFAQDMGQQLDLPIIAVDSAEAAAGESDLVAVAIRPGSTPALFADWLAPGAHVTAISAVRPEARELEDAVWRRSAVVAVDDRAHVFESGDGRSALASGSIQPEQTVELWELAGGRHPGRQAADEITLFKSVGTALQDLAVAAALYKRARERGLGEELGDFPHARK